MDKLCVWLWVSKDITDRKLADEALRQSEDWYRTIFENTGTATLILDEDTTIALANTEFEKLSGFTVSVEISSLVTGK
ncbi:MAG: PAS domain S-box protein [Syntrophales bacterium]|jgi:PAS domain-containing protein